MKQHDVEVLIDKYLDGLTSGKEEAALRKYFTEKGKDIPAEWMVYKALFRYEKAERKEETRNHWSWHRIAVWTAAAAACAVVTWRPWQSAGPCDGNYAVIDGNTVTTEAAVRDAAHHALAIISADTDMDFNAIDIINQNVVE